MLASSACRANWNSAGRISTSRGWPWPWYKAIRVTGFSVTGDRTNLLLDPDDGRILQEEGSRGWALIAGVVELHYEDWREIEGVLFPFRLWWESDAQGRVIFQFEEAEVSSDFDIHARIAEGSANGE